MSTVGEHVLLSCQQISVDSTTLSEVKASHHTLRQSLLLHSPKLISSGEGLEN
jgi:hypothetical protein